MLRITLSTLLVGLVAGLTPASFAADKPNIVLIFADDKYGRQIQNCMFCRENTAFQQQTPNLQMSINCRDLRAIALN